MSETKMFPIPISIVGIIFFVVCGMVLGWCVNEIYEDYRNEGALSGLYFRNWGYEEVVNYTEERDSEGDWVCVNIRNMDYDRAVEVCKHEVGHEIFAEICEKDIDKCYGVLKGG